MNKGRVCLARIICIAMTVAWMVLIFMFSNQPGSLSADISNGVSFRIVSGVNNTLDLDMEDSQVLDLAQLIDYPVRKAAHMTEYAILCILSFLTVLSFGKSLKTRNIFSLILVMIYASTDEIHQLFVVGRSGKFTDVLVDFSGACLMLLLVNVVILIHNRIKKNK